MIDLIDVSKSYGPGLPAVNHANLHIDKGEFVFIVGNSGSGKTTLIKLLMKELASIITMAACIFLFGIFFSIVNNVNNIAHKVEQEVPITVFFEEGRLTALWANATFSYTFLSFRRRKS